MYLFDANAIVELAKKRCLGPLAYGVTLDLAVYETTQAVWKEYSRIRNSPLYLDREAAGELLNVLREVFDHVIRLASIRGREANVFELAVNEGITVYDAAYLYYAAENGLALVTNDRRLRERARQYVKAMTVDELLLELGGADKVCKGASPAGPGLAQT
ncbi:MAG: DNA-binding protein [Acidianus sp.]|nr:DNA-binding protein [Acidianus sp.]